MQEPLVKRLENQVEARAVVIRVDIFSDVGRALADQYDARVVPTFIIFDSTGEIVWRGSSVPSAETVLATN